MAAKRASGPVARSVPPVWLRGPARYEQGWITLDRSRAEEYQPRAETGRLYLDLARIWRPPDALVFAAQHGLLWHGPGSDTLRESFADWEDEARGLRATMWSYLMLREA